MSNSRNWVALLLFIVFASIYLAAIVKIDNTNIGTTNGLWKTPMVRGWEMGSARQLDSGEWLYAPLYGFLCRLIPDRWVSYGTPAPVLTFRKMAMLNGIFGGLASAFVFLLALRMLASVIASFVAALAHGCAAFVIVNSINSEDILPAYTFFVLMTILLCMYIERKRLGYLIAAGVCCAMLTLLHWTLMLPALAGAFVIGVAVLFNDRRRGWMLPIFLGAFLLSLELFVLAFGHAYSIRQILYPSKAGASGYLGLHWTKLLFTAIGIGNYFVGGRNISDYPAAFRDANVLAWMRISWAFAAITLAALAWAATRRDSRITLRMLAIFGLAVFGAAEIEHLYSQPQDPQSQIQPMFASILGVIVILGAAQRVDRAWLRRAAVFGLGALFIWEGGYNTLLLMTQLGADSRFMKTAAELAQTFPAENTVLVTNGWEEWNAWIYIENFGGDGARFAERNIGLANGFVEHPGISPAAAADLMARQIQESLKHGRVVANVIWAGSSDDFAASLTSLVNPAEARMYTSRLKSAFHTGRTWITSAGKFVELQN